MICEHKQDNSGIPQGNFLKRNVYKNNQGKIISPFDINVGENFNVMN